MAPAEGEVLALDAPAKVNLFLHVTGRREDGYHLLESVVAFTEVCDRLYAEPADGGQLSLTVDGPFARDIAGNASDNLVFRAAQRLRSAARTASGASLRLEKNLPVAAGIGGGSADAAAALRLLARLWQVPRADETLSAIAAELGADVPVCLRSVPARFTGVGEVVEPVAPLPVCGVVLANARQPVPTPAVFAARAGAPFSPVLGWRPPSDFDDFAARLAALGNDLAEAARRISPAIGDVIGALSETAGCRLARLSGSGGTCFGLYADAAAAAAAADTVAAAHPDWWVVSTAFRNVPAEIADR